MAFRSVDDVERWITEEGGTADYLRAKLAEGLYSGGNATWARAYLERLDRGEVLRRDLAADDRADRALAASERSATAAEAAATNAGKSARWAKWAVLIALAALLVSAWPHFPK